jgi:hypothetical protein
VSDYQFGWTITCNYAEDVSLCYRLDFAWVSLFYLDEDDYQQRLATKKSLAKPAGE